MAPTAVDMTAAVLEKQPGQWDLVLIALCPFVNVKRCSDPVRAIDGSRHR